MRIRGLDCIVGKTFKLSRLLCMFPFCVSKQTLIISYKHLLLSAAFVVYINVFAIRFLIRVLEADFFHGSKLLLFTHFFPTVCSALVPPLNLIWLIYKKKKLVEVFRIILDLEGLTGHITPDPNIHASWAIVLLMACHFSIHAALLLPTGYKHLFGAGMQTICSTTSLFILIQFNSLISLVGNHYQNILNTANTVTVNIFCRVHEKLGQSCRYIGDCYAPQLLLITSATFINIICNSYQAILAAIDDIYAYKKLCLALGIRIALYCVVIFYIASRCSTTISKVSITWSCSIESYCRTIFL